MMKVIFLTTGLKMKNKLKKKNPERTKHYNSHVVISHFDKRSREEVKLDKAF